MRAVDCFAAAAVLSLGVAGCGSLALPRMPEVAPGYRREQVSSGRSVCTPRRCTNDVAVGARHYRVETVTRVLSSKEVGGGSNAAGRAAGGLFGWIVRRAGVSTIDEQVVVGTRTVTTDGAWRLECAVAWIDERERSKDSTQLTRVTEGVSCEVRSDSAEASGGWTFRYGATPTVDSMALLLHAGDRARSTVPVLSSRESGVFRVVEEFLDPAEKHPRTAGWRVERPDGTPIGALRLPPGFTCFVYCALDLAAPTGEEERVLRLIAAALMIPL